MGIVVIIFGWARAARVTAASFGMKRLRVKKMSFFSFLKTTFHIFYGSKNWMLGEDVSDIEDLFNEGVKQSAKRNYTSLIPE